MNRESNEADTLQRILREAASLFVRAGYEGASMREIAEAVGITKAALYYHFQDKQDLFMAVLNASLEEVGAILDAAEGSSQVTRGRIEATMQGLLGMPGERRALIRVTSQEMGHVSPEVRAEFNAVYHRKFIGRIAAMIAEGIARGELRPIDPQLAAWLLLGMAYPFFAPGPANTTEGIAGEIVRVFFEGLGK